ncbi:GGDEF domain-containing protein [Agrobacterium tumefaciens]|uniref:GGDEF domain-containing protein n=1 Tax=Agrobacterium tumefaciens TaxID=358 RepID=UPI002243CBBC|nr:GGDEF domain-containing protein [Agrobacterium tumefaciens]MCW8060549.1 GGDEF domain-containing protein [Agrobacterium tumefaciens]MCW8145992.1 GGDEF domain-containing protein [Agrobacterium tumefaciens]
MRKSLLIELHYRRPAHLSPTEHPYFSMPVTLLDWSVPTAILLCGLIFITMKFLGFATSRWGYALCCLGIGYAIMLFETGYATPFKQIVEDNFIVASAILACHALNDRLQLKGNLAFDVAVLLTSTVMVGISRTMFDSARLETLFVQACCALVLWNGYIRFSKLAAAKSDRALSFTFLLLAVVLTGQCLLYIAAPEPELLIGAWRTSVWGNLIQFTGLIGSIILVFSVVIATTYDAIEKYRGYANTDPLTKLLNRRGLDALLASAGGKRFKNASTAVILTDIDHFGHAFGDLVIERFGRLLLSHATAQGYVARLGGEEFAVLLPDTSLDEAIAAADKMRRAFAAELWPRNGEGSEFTASFGVTLAEDAEVLWTTFERADHFLYAAKRSGRNCVAAAKYVWSEAEDTRLLFVGQPSHEDAVHFTPPINQNTH